MAGQTEIENTGIRAKNTDHTRGLIPWQPGQSGNPSGRPKKDKSADISVAIFERNEDEIYQAMLKALKKGDSRVFQVLADRGYGKLKEQVEHSGEIGVSVVNRLLSARKRLSDSNTEDSE